MPNKDTFWRSVATMLVVLLALSAVTNIVWEGAVPRQVTLLLFGCLVALGIARAVENPATSPVILSAQQEMRFRRGQYAVGFVFSALLVLLLVLTELRETALGWLFVPIIALPFGLVIRAWRKRC